MRKAEFPIDLKGQIFSRADGEFFLFEEDDREGLGIAKGVWFGVSVSDGATRREGLIRLVPVLNREPVDVEIRATPCFVELIAKEGKLTLVMDTTGSMRIYGEGLGVMIHKEMPVMSLETITEVRSGVADYNLFVPTGGGGRLVFSSVSGAFSVDSKAILTAGGINICTIWMEPGKDGLSETLVTPAVPAEGAVASVAAADAIASVKSAFEEFTATLPDFAEGGKYTELLARCAYAMWIARRPAGKNADTSSMKSAMFCRSRVTDTQCSSRYQPLFALATADPEAAKTALCSVLASVRDGMMPEVVCTSKLRYAYFPKYHAFALAAILDGGVALDKAEAAELYRVFRADLERTVETHSFDEGKISCLTPNETGIPSLIASGTGFPLETPEFYTQMIFAAELTGRLERLAEAGSGVYWFDLSRKWLAVLTDELWNGKTFCFRESFTGRLLEDGNVLSFIPVLLGKRLPENILTALAENMLAPENFGDHGIVSAAGGDTVDVITNVLCAIGLCEAGRTDAAAAVADALLKDAAADGAAKSRAVTGSVPEAVRPGDAYDAATAAALVALAAAVSL